MFRIANTIVDPLCARSWLSTTLGRVYAAESSRNFQKAPLERYPTVVLYDVPLIVVPYVFAMLRAWRYSGALGSCVSRQANGAALHWKLFPPSWSRKPPR